MQYSLKLWIWDVLQLWEAEDYFSDHYNRTDWMLIEQTKCTIDNEIEYLKDRVFKLAKGYIK